MPICPLVAARALKRRVQAVTPVIQRPDGDPIWDRSRLRRQRSSFHANSIGSQ